MSIASPHGWADVPPPFPVRRFRVDEYHQMIEAGMFAQNESFELLEGWIVPKTTRNPPQDVVVVLAQTAIHAFLPAGWHVRGQSAITTDDSEPEPDVAAVRGLARNYLSHHPKPEDIELLIEAADATLLLDRTSKARLYARARIAIYWLINIPESRVEVYTDPSGPGANPSYGRRHDYGPSDVVPVVLDGKEIGQIPVRDLLP